MTTDIPGVDMDGIALETAFQGALWCADRGWKVFPLRKGGTSTDQKRPAVSDWENVATADKVKIAEWEASHPQTNWGLACGPSGLVVVDLDVKEDRDGRKALEQLESLHGKLPFTMRVRSASGQGIHLYFTGSGSNSASRLGPGIDTRGSGGYVVAPGAVFQDGRGAIIGRYSVEVEAAPASLPGWIGSALTKQVAAPAAPVGMTIPEGGRDHAMTSLAGSLRQRGLDQQEIESILSIVNESRCVPPLPESDLRRISRSVCQYAAGTLAREIDLFEKFHTAVRNTKEISHAGAIRPDELPARDWIVPGRYLVGTIALLLGPGGASKSSLALLEAIAIATGTQQIAGLPHPQETHPVLYFNAEDPKVEIERRIAAICQQCSIPLDTLSHLHYISGQDLPLRFATVDSHNIVVLNEVALGWLRDTVKAKGIQFVVLDPWVGLHCAPENDNGAIDQVCGALKKAAADCGAAILVVHHSRKLNGAEGSGDAEISRGASSLVNAARYAATLRGMSVEDATEIGLNPELRHNFARRDDAKSNYSVQAAEADWFRRESVCLAHLDPNAPAQSVGVLVPQKLSDLVGAGSDERDALSHILARILSPGARITVYSLSEAVVANAEDRAALGGKGRSTIQRIIVKCLKCSLLLPSGNTASTTMIEGKQTVVISGNREGDFVL